MLLAVSGHSRGATVDLTLLDCRAGDGDCQALDMGTDFDFFDPRANTDSPAITASACRRRWRGRDSATILRSGGTSAWRPNDRRPSTIFLSNGIP